jgi:hypothetical protein
MREVKIGSHRPPFGVLFGVRYLTCTTRRRTVDGRAKLLPVDFRPQQIVPRMGEADSPPAAVVKSS